VSDAFVSFVFVVERGREEETTLSDDWTTTTTTTTTRAREKTVKQRQRQRQRQTENVKERTLAGPRLQINSSRR